MRLATWNCCGGPLPEKMTALSRLAADLAVVPESPRPPTDLPGQIWVGEPKKKGLAILAGPGIDLELVDVGEALLNYIVPIQVRGPRLFLLLAVWTQNGGDDKYVRGLVRAVDACASHISSQDTVVMGDFNSNTVWDKEHPKDRNHSALVQELDSLGLESAYHAKYGEEQGAEQQHTFFFHKNEESRHHIDYCFIPKAWRGALKSVTVEPFADWKKYSDHVLWLLISVRKRLNKRLRPERGPFYSTGFASQGETTNEGY